MPLFYMGCMNSPKEGRLPEQADLAAELSETLLRVNPGKYIVITKARHTKTESFFLVSIRDKQGAER